MGIRGISQWAEKNVDEIITSEPRPFQSILDDLFKQAGKSNSASNKSTMPTRNELQYYLARNYSKVFLIDATNKPVKTNYKATVHYFRGEE